MNAQLSQSNKSIFLAGDSTVANYPSHQSPMAGWGQLLGSFFTEAVTIHNYALCGRTTRSFIEQGHLDRMHGAIREGDMLLIQFGHNDQKEKANISLSDYKAYLTSYVEKARSRNADPVLITPVQRRHFDENRQLLHTHGEYPSAMKELAVELSVPLIDLGVRTRELYESLGSELSKSLFVWLEAGQHANYPDGAKDDTHFSEQGARRVAELVAAELRKNELLDACYFIA